MFIRYLAVIAVAAVLSACGSSSSPSSPTPTTNSGSTITLGVGASALTSNAFGTNPLIVSTGTTVTWTNRDSVAHTSTANNGAWNGSLAAGGSFNFTFTTTGSFPYRCTLHPGMVGVITVQ